MPLESDTYSSMTALAELCRNGQWNDLPGVVEERAQVYRGLVYGVFSDTLERAYPLAHTVLSTRMRFVANGEASEWQILVDDFVAKHPSQSPQLWKMPGEFCEFVSGARYAERFEFPALDDLLRFEWIEIAIHMEADRGAPSVRPEGSMRTDRVVINPQHRILHFAYPVFRSLEDIVTADPGQYFLLGYRHPVDLCVRFIELRPIFVFCLELLANRPMSGDELWTEVQQFVPGPEGEREFFDILETFRAEGMLLGFLTLEGQS